MQTLYPIESDGLQGVDITLFSPRHRSEAWRRRISRGYPEAPILLYVGRLTRESRAAWLLPMIDALPYAHLVIVGDGPMRAELEETFGDTPTVFTGRLNGEALSCAYASADLFIYPSTGGASSRVVLEAMSSGLPVIAPRVRWLAQHVVDGETGFLFEPDRLEELVALARWVTSNPAHAQRLGASARAYAETKSWDEIADCLLGEYTALIRRQAGMDGVEMTAYGQRHWPVKPRTFPIPA